MSPRNTLIALVLVAAASSALTIYLRPAVTKTVEVTKDVLKSDIKTIIQYKEHPNGTKESTTTIVDNSQRVVQAQKTQQVVIKRDWLVGASAATDFSSAQPIYGLHAHRRIIGPFYAGLTANSKQELGISLSFEF